MALTAHTSEEDRADCTEAGMDSFMTKPITPAVRDHRRRSLRPRKSCSVVLSPVWYKERVFADCARALHPWPAILFRRWCAMKSCGGSRLRASRRSRPLTRETFQWRRWQAQAAEPEPCSGRLQPVRWRPSLWRPAVESSLTPRPTSSGPQSPAARASHRKPPQSLPRRWPQALAARRWRPSPQMQWRLLLRRATARKLRHRPSAFLRAGMGSRCVGVERRQRSARQPEATPLAPLLAVSACLFLHLLMMR